uniref:Fibronectin type-II domain-containing protein n=1 Tax=Podarcis muralis TaxID=64176 RepID=A0A670JL49_PODMU
HSTFSWILLAALGVCGCCIFSICNLPRDIFLDISKEAPKCAFPFIFEGKLYMNCTASGRNDGKLWCSTTSNYDVDKKWMFCEDSGKESPSCTFPFIYKGNSYSTCTTEGMSDGKHWCATTSNYDKDEKWMYCNVTGRKRTAKVFGLV